MPSKVANEIRYERESLFDFHKKWQPRAVEVIKEKIAHYKKTGNQRKLAIYESKLKGSRNILRQMKKIKI